MAIDTSVSEFEYPGEEEVGTPPKPPPHWRRSAWLQPNVLWAMAGGVVGYLIGHWLGNVIGSGYQQVQTSQNDVAIVLGLTLGVAGWMAGIGALNYPLAKVLGFELSPAPPQRSWVRYFRMTEDHKVVGWQYAVGVLLFLFTGGLLAMLIRTELLSPTNHVFGPGTYIALVGEHGTIMMMMASSAIVGPLGNWLVPLMIGSRRMAYPTRGGLLVLDLHGRLPGDRQRACSSVASRPAGPGTRRCRPRPSGAWTPIWSGSR